MHKKNIEGIFKRKYSNSPMIKKGVFNQISMMERFHVNINRLNLIRFTYFRPMLPFYFPLNRSSHRSATLSKKRLWHLCFLMNFVKH